MKNLVIILVAILLTSCGDSENKEAISREERVMKKEFDMKTCGPQWNFGFDFGRVAKIASDSKRDCDWAFLAWKISLACRHSPNNVMLQNQYQRRSARAKYSLIVIIGAID